MTRLAQGLLLVAALALWAGSRMAWVDVASSDGLGQPKTTTLTGASWSEALVPLALLVLAAAVAALAVRGWPLRLLAVLVAVSSAGMAYPAIGLWVIPDAAVWAAAAELAQLPVAALVDTQRHYWGATLSLIAALCTLAAAVLLTLAYALYASHAMFGRLYDDTHITLRYAENMADGDGLRFNPGQQPVEGYTNFLLTVFLAGCAKARDAAQ